MFNLDAFIAKVNACSSAATSCREGIPKTIEAIKGKNKSVDALTATVATAGGTEHGKEKEKRTEKSKGSSKGDEVEKDAEVGAGSVRSSRRSGKYLASVS